MAEAFVGVGSNQDPVTALRAATRALQQRFGRVVCSPVYRGPAMGLAAADYLNVVVRLRTEWAVDVLKAELAAIEAAAGRDRADPRVVRLDLDLLAYGARVDAVQRLPRPGLYSLPFVLLPLADVAPDLVHPLTGQRSSAARAAAPGVELENLGALDELSP
ncbi:MAG TPA: 2-amino-4-hydroxy-6-hydroxymethyldihydropteridine diphosphokinase [Gammaproteobacteria bacterium]|jgi:2-amino-4-hydroxy-6-hydroxymethyldihydropteridine diphosphokinase|nr:2-amino-4-hydroxy-6-hydroxymethyldihydropteridine diphosphokinase [Gammaproteobacteria bacterium]